MRSITHLVIAVTITAAVMLAAPQRAAAAPPRDGIFIHLSHGPEDPHRVLMAIRMATMMAEDKDVLLYIDVTGVLAVTKHAPDMEKHPFPNHKKMIAQLVKKGIGVYACPGCMEAYGVKQDDLLPGIKVANKEAFFGFTKGRILTLDY